MYQTKSVHLELWRCGKESEVLGQEKLDFCLQGSSEKFFCDEVLEVAYSRVTIDRQGHSLWSLADVPDLMMVVWLCTAAGVTEVSTAWRHVKTVPQTSKSVSIPQHMAGGGRYLKLPHGPFSGKHGLLTLQLLLAIQLREKRYHWEGAWSFLCNFADHSNYGRDYKCISKAQESEDIQSQITWESTEGASDQENV